MSLEELHAEVESYRAEASTLADEYARVHAEVTNDPALTNVGQREHLEPLHEQISEKMAALHAREKTAVTTYKEKLERSVFGLSPSASNDPTRVVSFRDAQARARDLDDSEDAQELYESAKRSGDDILAAAILEKALVRGWSTIKNDYLERNASKRDTLDDLTALAKYTDNTLSVTAQYMPPSANLPRPAAGFQNTGGHTTSAQPKRVPNLADVISQRLGQN